MLTEKDFVTPVTSTWCKGCGNFGIWTALRTALAELKIPPHMVAAVFDIGCGGNSCNWYNVYCFHSLHGRALPVAFGAKLANHQLTVLAVAGDGGAYGEGGNHFLHSCRGNIDLTFIVSDNQLYSLTTGQACPTTSKGMVTKSTPEGVIEKALSPLQIAISAGATFVARGYADDVKHLTNLIKQAITHRGFALVDVLQPCVTLNKVNTREWFKKRVYKLKRWNPTNKKKALIKAGEWGKKIPIGLFYQEKRPTYEDQLPQLVKKPLVKQSVKVRNISQLLKQFK
jgi:2-oxoglutarate ferredoxin oxidoreductase subunit beta